MSKIKKLLKICITAGMLAIILVSCGPKVIFSKTVSIDGPWKYNDSKSFEFEILDTLLPYNLVLEVRHAEDFSFENVYVNITTTFPDATKTTRPLSLQLADNNGYWQGNCSSGTCLTNIPLAEAAYYQKPGKYTLDFEQYSRKEDLEGILSLKIEIIEAKPE